MKVMIVAPYIYEERWPEFSRNRTGFGMIVRDLFFSLSSAQDVYLLTNVITKGYGSILSHTWAEVLKSARPSDWIAGLKLFFNYHQGLKKRCRYFVYGLNTGYFEKTIKEYAPDIIHIHGIGMATKPYIDACVKKKVPFILTLHGLIGLDESIKTNKWDKELEKEFLIYASDHSIPVTVISSGIKKRIEKNYLNHIANNITVIPNGTSFLTGQECLNEEYSNLREKYSIKNNDSIIVVIGSICENKNQQQIIRALALSDIRNKSHVFLCGMDSTNGELEKLIVDNHLTERVHVLGFVSHDTVHQILEQATLNIVASKNEGFGLSVIEAFSHGIPTVCFSDIDSVDDLYSKDSMMLVEERTDEALAKTIEDALIKKWKREDIISHSKLFSMDRMVKSYQNLYFKIGW